MCKELRGLEPLTEKSKYGTCIPLLKNGDSPHWCLSGMRDGNSNQWLYGDAADRLALYESHVPALIARLDEMEKAQTEGRAVVLPCKRGDVVWAEGWTTGEYGEADAARVSYDFDSKVTHVYYRPRKPDTACVRIADGCRTGVYGKTVFLSSADAQKGVR
jgi:hypothetical protein